MVDYQLMYAHLFNAVTDTITQLQRIQQATEEIYITATKSADENSVSKVETKSLIHDMFHGKLIPASVPINGSTESHCKKAKELLQFEKSFYSTLSDSQKAEFDKYTTASMNLLISELEQSFTDGFKSGIRLIYEAVGEPKNTRSQGVSCGAK